MLTLMILSYPIRACTVWKFQNFCATTQILCEINFEESKSSKDGIFCNSRGSQFGQFGKFQPSKSAEIAIYQNLLTVSTSGGL